MVVLAHHSLFFVFQLLVHADTHAVAVHVLMQEQQQQHNDRHQNMAELITR